MRLRAGRPSRGPTLTANHRQMPFNWARNHVRWRQFQRNNVLFRDESRFMQKEVDGRCKVYAARVCYDFLRRQNINILPWPALSADMLPIEHLWDMLGRWLRQRHQQPRTLNEPCQALVLEWRRLPLGLLRRLVGSMHRQCQAMFAARGGYTGYLIDMVIFETPYFLKGLLNSSVGFDRKRLR